MFKEPVVFVDIETTGGSARNSRVLEVAAIRYENGEVVSEFSTLINPDTYIPAFITSITGITEADVVDAPRFADIAADLSDILDGAIFVAHNVNFDYSFIKNEFALLGGSYNAKRLCTVRLSRKLYAYHKGHSLEKLITRHNLSFENRHRALDDARAIAEFARIAYDEHGPELFDEAVTHQLKSQYMPINLSETAIKQIETTPGVYVFKDDNDTVLYVGKSINMRARVISHFQDLTSKEQHMASKTKHIETIPTGSEFLALVLESFLVKRLQPIHNVKLRKVTQYTMAVRTENEAGYPTISYQAGLPDEIDDIGSIYGLYESRMKAKKWNELIMKTYDLCPKLMGLETGKGACFNHGLGRCKGACVGREDTDRYTERFEIALEKKRISTWPFEGAITLPVSDDGAAITVDNWTITDIENVELPYMSELGAKGVFDYDIYQLLRTKLKTASPSTIS